MSHFTCLVIGPTNEAELTAALDPFDENNHRLSVEGEDYESNPNAKWDWYSIGGRWMGFFKLKPGVVPRCGEPGVFDSQPKDLQRGDMCRKDEIDIEGMQKEKGDAAAECWDRVHNECDMLSPHETWESLCARLEIEAAREFYLAQPRVKSFIQLQKTEWGRKHLGFSSSVEDYFVPREEFIQSARDSAIRTFAVLYNGQWYEKGQMGWWACVSNEKDEATWNQEFTKLFDSLPDDAMLTLVDCHI